uniref:Vacuolar ATPase assembly protein VMA22 n=1 Tax=Canavalia gladiata TaxID=3824 RepID=A0AAN9QYA7_CANGL
MIIEKNLSELADNDEVQKERSKSLLVFGILISPKLRATQLSFERALETLLFLQAARNASHVDNLNAVLGIQHYKDFSVQFIDLSEDSEMFPLMFISFLCWQQLHEHHVLLSKRGKGFTRGVQQFCSC